MTRLPLYQKGALVQMGIECWQIELGGQWKDYKEKPDRLLKEAFQRFLRKLQQAQGPEELANLEERYTSINVNGRKMHVDFLTMIQLRVDNKKEYKICPPQAPRSEACELTCQECKQLYTVSRCSDCRWCDTCYPTNVTLKAARTVPDSAACVEPPDKTGVPQCLLKALSELEPMKVTSFNKTVTQFEPMKVTLDSLAARYDTVPYKVV